MFRILLKVYSLLYLAGIGLFSLVASLRWLKGGKRTAILPRLVLSGGDVPRRATTGPSLWVHAVSVGEVNAIRPLVQTLLARGYSVSVSTTTTTGQSVARDRLPEEVGTFYFPLDLLSLCRRRLRQIRPQAVLLAETEIWPNFLTACSDLKIPVLLINGRISDRSFERYRRALPLLRPILRKIDHFCMQSKQDKGRVLALEAAPEKVNWVGNLKYDYETTRSRLSPTLKMSLQQILKPDPDHLLLVCGSTKPGEEAILIPLFCRLRSRGHRLRLLLAPRHCHRAAEIAELLREAGLPFLLRSRLAETEPSSKEAVILDSVGELAGVYEIADLVFIGGSLVPTGGQNIIEPAAFGKPILFGPHMSNFREIAATFVESYAALQVKDAEELEERLADLSQDPHAREWLGRNARKVIRQNQGAVERTVEILERYL